MQGTTFLAELIVRPKDGVADPQADAVSEALLGIGCADFLVRSVGRCLRLEVVAQDEAEARHRVTEMCRCLLVNPNLETFELALREA